MGGVKDRYLKYVSARDQYVGCYANCADQNSDEFSVSPPHFNFYSFEMSDRISHKKELYKFLSDSLYKMTDDADYGNVEYLAKMLCASVCHHHEYLPENLHPQILFKNLHVYVTFLTV